MSYNALHNRHKLKIACAVSHMDEITLDLCEKSLEKQTVTFDCFKVVAGFSPMCTSFNVCLDFAWENECDLLFHTASDVDVSEQALENLLEAMDLDEHYLTVGRGYDIFNGSGAPVGIWLFNLRIFKNIYRFRDEFLQDLKLCQRAEEGTGKTRSYTEKKVKLGYHHPIWTASDMYMKYRYATQKYKTNTIQKYIGIFERELSYNPENKPLRLGYDVLKNNMGNVHDLQSKNYTALMKEFTMMKTQYDLDGTEYYVHHLAYKKYAQDKLNSVYDCITVEERLEGGE